MIEPQPAITRRYKTWNPATIQMPLAKIPSLILVFSEYVGEKILL
jgi:hypothetical protein